MPRIKFDQVILDVDAPTDTAETIRLLGPLSLELTEHRVGIIGANGSGKSTLARLINGLASPTSGKVLVDGLDVAREGKKVRERVGFVFSDADSQIIMPTVRDDVAFSLRRYGLKRAERQQRAEETLSRFGLLNHADDSPHTLSGGQKQLLALASVLIIDPAIIIADEPTTLLDLHNRLLITQRFRELEQQLVVVTHDLDLLSDFDRVICINKGIVTADGPPTPVIEHYVKSMNGGSL